MHRHAALLLCALVAAGGGLLAAPAPAFKPWVHGWYGPVDSFGDCRFRRDGARLTISIPNREHYSVDRDEGLLNSPRLLRDAVGDFRVRCRVGGDFRPSETGELYLVRIAGILVTDEKTFVRLGRAAFSDSGEPTCFHLVAFHKKPSSNWEVRQGTPLEKPAYLQLERQGDLLLGYESKDGKDWQQLGKPLEIKFPRKVKVGVTAESVAPGPFVAVFDQFELNPLADKTRRPRPAR